MSDIASKIAAELLTHQPSGWGCLCGGWTAHQWRSWVDLATQFRDHAAEHIATATEAAVRARIAADIREARPETGLNILVTERRVALRDGMDRAARIAEGGTS